MIGTLGELGVNVGQDRTDIVVAVVAGYTVLGLSVHVGQRRRCAAQQSRRTIRIVLHMATRACVQGNGGIRPDICRRQSCI